MAETLTVVGASVRAVAESAIRAGLEPLAGDLFVDLDLQAMAPATRVSSYPRGLARVVAGPQPGGWMYTGGLENHPALIDRLGRLRPLWGNGADVLRRVRDPHLVADALRAAGLICPQLRSAADGPPRGGQWLEKPLRSSGGLHVRRYVPGARLAQRGACYFQQFIDGTACGAVYLAGGGECWLLGISQQLSGVDWLYSPGFTYAGSIGPLSLSPPVREQFRAIGAVLASEFSLLGLFGVDAIIADDDLVWPVEINPRYTASVEVLERAYGWAALSAQLATCRTGRLAPAAGMSADAAPPRLLYGKAVLFAERSLRIGDELARRWLAASSAANNATDSEAAAPQYADVPRPGTTIPPGGPIITLLAAGSNVSEVRHKLQALALATQHELEISPLPSRERGRG